MDNSNSNSNPASAIVEAFVNAIVEQVLLKMSTLDHDAVNSLAERVRRIEDTYVSKDEASDMVSDAIDDLSIDSKVEEAIGDLNIDRQIEDALDNVISDLRITR